MKEISQLQFLIDDYDLSYKYQKFENCYGGDWIVETHSFYNDTGCFTIYNEVQRGIDFCYSSHFSTERSELCERGIDVTTIEPQIWDKHRKIWIFKRPFFWCSDSKVLHALAEVLKTHLEKGNDLFGISVQKL
jgi:hypothetical protein